MVVAMQHLRWLRNRHGPRPNSPNRPFLELKGGELVSFPMTNSEDLAGLTDTARSGNMFALEVNYQVLGLESS